MPIIKKLLFAPLFIVFLISLIYLITPFLRSYDLIYSLSSNTLIQMIIISLLVTLSSLAFSLFACLALDWRIILPVGILTSLIPFLFIEPAWAIVFMIGILISLFLVFIGLQSQMKSYLTFNPNSILGPSIRYLSTLLIIIISIIYFLSVNKMISEKGFVIPDSLIDTALEFAAPSNEQSEDSTPQISIPKEQLDLLRQNPDLIRQSGLDPKILDTLDQPQKNIAQVSNDLLKQTVKDQFQSFLKPYLSFIPAVLALLLFFTLQGLTSFINLLIYPLLWIIFFILEKSGFIKFTLEQRSVKKLVV